MNQKPPPPFSCTYTPQVPALLHGLGCSIALSTYQAGKVVFLSAKDEQSLSQLPRNFEKAMGVAEDPETDRLAIACLNQVLGFSQLPATGSTLPQVTQRVRRDVHAPCGVLHGTVGYPRRAF